ncbi:hypothetical protein N9K75_03080, partial [bacterium]|nr:hypothetical protein [bacterium]
INQQILIIIIMSVTVFSIYIPRIKCVYCGEKYVSRVFDEAGVGTVSRVDFTSIQKCAGFTEEHSDEEELSAFVHFKQLYKNPLVGVILKHIQDEIPFRFFPHKTSAFGNGSKNEGGMYWMLLPNLFPVPETRMNTSQIVENCRFLEKTVADQAERIVLLEKNLTNCVKVVYQMTGGMWCQKTQGSSIDRHLKHLYGEMDPFNPETEEDQDTSKWGIWPTTRQGDANETRIEELERKLAELTAPKVYPAYEAWRNEPNLAFDLDDDLRSIGSPLSISDIRAEDDDDAEDEDEQEVDDNSEDTPSSLPGLIDIVSDGSEQSDGSRASKRVVNSYDLCGNE